ncbi:glycosyltransferase family 4 protein [Bacillus sp. 31A1R]|uniref:Glycosyltransferase family 4 protein n=2 Tax=Robertmurraya mangrovi TaxID=3098077 RepID=A0ABU5J1M0_9BACI|nr:glycosyltransferase family 4 protein [Bacillus sp. 31A1R]
MAETESNRNWYYHQYKKSFTVLMDQINLGKKDLFINRFIKKTLQSFSPDLVIAAGSYNMPTVLRLLTLKKTLNFKLLFWSESNLVKRENLKGIKKTIREMVRFVTYKNFDGFWYSGELSKDFIEKYTTKGKEMYFLPNLVDNSLYESVDQIKMKSFDEIITFYHLDISKRLFICPARLSEQKGIIEFLSLFINCRNAENASILIAGDGELNEKIEEIIKQNKHLDIRLLGFKSQDEMLKLYSIADFFLLPSVDDPNPLTCIEALWCGLPLLISDQVGNYPEVLVPGKNGYLFSYKDPENTIRQIEKAIDSNLDWINSAKDTSRMVAKNLYDPERAIAKCVKEMINSFN